MLKRRRYFNISVFSHAGERICYRLHGILLRNEISWAAQKRWLVSWLQKCAIPGCGLSPLIEGASKQVPIIPLSHSPVVT